MGNKEKFFSIAVFFVFLILLSSTASATTVEKAYIENNFDGTINVIDTATNTITATITNVGPYPYGIAISPDGTKVYVANGGNSVSVIDTATNNITASISAGLTPQGITVTPDGTKVYVANVNDNTVSVIDTTTNAVTATIPAGSNPQGVAVTPDGTKVYVANLGSNDVSVIDTATNTVTTTIPAGSGSFGVVVSPDGTKIYVANDGGSVSVIDTATNTVIATIPVVGDAFAITVIPDGTKVYVGSYNVVSVIDATTNTVTDTVNIGGVHDGIAATSDGTKVYVTNQYTNSISIIDTATNTVTATLPVGNGPTSFGQFIGSIPVKSTPIITWSNPADIIYGTPLSSTQLNAVATDPVTSNPVPGTFTYTPAAGTVLNAGSGQTLHVDFTPDDTVNYNTASADVTINVSQATPTITWNNPADIAYGIPLSNTQLNAVASVPGTYVYTPAAGTILNVGNAQNLHVDFTPTDTTNYTTAAADVTINVKLASFSSITASGFHAPTTFGLNGYDYIWFNSNFKASGVKDGTTIYLTNSIITTEMGNFSVPSAIITFSKNATSTTTNFDQSQHTLITTVPLSGTDDIFLSGVLSSIKSGDLPHDSQATWSGYFSTNTKNVSLNWKWGAAVYTSSLPYNDLGVKASHNLASGYNNGDQAGTPENLKDSLVAGARGGGGSNWCGSWSGTASVKS